MEEIIHYRRAESKDLPTIMKMTEKMIKGLTDPQTYYSDDEAFMDKHLDGRDGYTLFAEVKGTVAAYLVLRFPRRSEDNLGGYAGLPPEEQMKVAHMEAVVVDSEYRGLGLQQKLMTEGERMAKNRGYVHAMATVYPKNLYSVNNLKALGYEILALAPKYQGWPRYIFYKKL